MTDPEDPSSRAERAEVGDLDTDDADPSSRAEAVDVGDLDLARLLDRFERTLLGGPRKHARADLSRAADIAPDEARRMWRALGFATVDDDAIVFTDGDVSALAAAKSLSQNLAIDDELLTAITRMLGQTFSRLAAWQGQLLVELVTSRPELLSSEQAIGQFLEELLPTIQDIQTYVWRRQLAAYFSRIVSHATGEMADSGTSTSVVGFADMSGSPRSPARPAKLRCVRCSRRSSPRPPTSSVRTTAAS